MKLTLFMTCYQKHHICAIVESTVHGGDFSGNDVQKVVGNYQDIVNVVLEYRYWQNGNGVNYYM